MKLKDLPITELPRERLLNVGEENLKTMITARAYIEVEGVKNVFYY